MSAASAVSSFVAHPFLTLQVQCVLYNLPVQSIERALTYLENATAQARRYGVVRDVRVAYGDCSPTRTLEDDSLDRLRQQFPGLSGIDYTYFDANLGSAEGHNRLMRNASTDLLMILNPDVIASPSLLIELCDALAKPSTGLVEARQLPIEHPKDYDPVTGETSWASTACAMGPTSLFQKLDGFDSRTFFLYCDDVDFSWRVRLAGFKVIHQCSAVVYHDKRVNHDGGWISTSAEQYYSAEAALLIAYKFSRPDLTERYLEDFRRSGVPALIKAAGAFEMRQRTGRLPTPVDADHQVGQFIEGAYSRHRFPAR